MIGAATLITRVASKGENMAKARRAIAKSDFVEKNLATALERLAVAAAAGERAVAVRGKDGKKLAITVKRLAKKRASLVKRKKSASTRARKSPSGDTRKALRAVVRELAGTSKLLVKAKAVKAANATEFAALRSASRRASGYQRAIAQIDRALHRTAD
jgi:hypothetical protein